MSVTFTCPNCRRWVMMDRIWPAVDLESNALDWQCKACDAVAPRASWGKSMDGTLLATNVFIYTGAAKNEPFMQKLPRAITRRAVYAGGHMASYDAIHKKVDFTSEDGHATYHDVGIWHMREKYLLRGRFYTPNEIKGTQVVMLLSGSGGVAAQYFNKVIHRYVKRVGVRVLSMDYRGFGGSDRKAPSEKGLFTDAEAMYSYLTADAAMGGLETPMRKVVVHGYSLGTGVAAELVKRKPGVGGLVLQCPFTSAAAMARQGGGVAGSIGGKLADNSAVMDVKGKAAGVTRPILLLIANQDANMKAHGDEIARDLAGMPNLTVARYDGVHEEPQNAFKDGSGAKTIMVASSSGGRLLDSRLEAPKRGEVFLKDPHGLAKGDNLKTSKGQGCIGDIQRWFAGL